MIGNTPGFVQTEIESIVTEVLESLNYTPMEDSDIERISNINTWKERRAFLVGIEKKIVDGKRRIHTSAELCEPPLDGLIVAGYEKPLKDFFVHVVRELTCLNKIKKKFVT